MDVIDETGAPASESSAVVSAWVSKQLKTVDSRLLTYYTSVTIGRVEDGEVYVKSYEMIPVLEGSPSTWAVTSAGIVLSGSHAGCPVSSYRKALYRFLLESVLSVPLALELPERYRVAARDVLNLSSSISFVGSTYWTNEDAIRTMMQSNVFKSQKVAIVRDLFDRNLKSRPHLDSVLFALDDSTTVAVLDTVLGNTNPKRRLVQEYTYDDAKGDYVLTVNDMELGEYLSLLGFKVVSVPSDIACGTVSLLPVAKAKFIAFECQSKLAEFYSKQGLNIEVLVAKSGSEGISACSLLKQLGTSLIVRQSTAIVAGGSSSTGIKHVKDIPEAHKPIKPYDDATARQTSNNLLMVAPIGFLSSAQTALDNYFMNKTTLPEYEVERLALEEYSKFHEALVSEGVHISLYRNERFYETPDAVFPNNWFSTHAPQEMATVNDAGAHGSKANGLQTKAKSTVVFYPMKAPSRRAERREHIVTDLIDKYDAIENFTYFEYQGKSGTAFEGTGCLVLDRVHKVAYCAISQRADAHIFHLWCKKMGYTPCEFESVDSNGRTVYHTNVVMGIGTSVAVVCAESVKDATQRSNLLKTLAVHHTVVQITLEQMNNFCGNVLEIAGAHNARLLVMSTRAHAAFTKEQHEVFSRHVKKVVHVPIPTIEDIGGGGVRCMMGELF